MTKPSDPWGKVVRPEPRPEEHWLARLLAQGDQPYERVRLKPLKRLRLRKAGQEKA